MTRPDFTAAITRMDAKQHEALRVCIMAERRLRLLYPRTAADGPAIDAAYDWALNAKPEPVVISLRSTT